MGVSGVSSFLPLPPSLLSFFKAQILSLLFKSIIVFFFFSGAVTTDWASQVSQVVNESTHESQETKEMWVFNLWVRKIRWIRKMETHSDILA